MAARVWLLFGLSLVSLVLLSSAGVGLAYSVPQGEGPERALVLPIAAPSTIHVGADGALLAIGEPGGAFPSSATNVTLERALAYANGTTNETVVVENVTMPNGTANLSLDLRALSGGHDGFVVKADTAQEPRFVETAQVVGQYVGSTTATWLITLFVVSLVGFMSPLIALVVTHRGGATSGAPALVCAECRAPMPAGAEFCQRCGAWRSRKEADG